MYGYDYISSPDFARLSANRKTDENGKISETVAQNDAGSMVLYRPDQWFWVMKRAMQMSVKYIDMADAYQFVTMTRVGICSRSGSDSKAVQLHHITL